MIRIKKIGLKKIRHILVFLDRRIINRNLQKSVYFYTFHKCASSLFSNYVLKNISGLDHVDYLREIYTKKRIFKKRIRFQKNNFIYGPIRISQDVITPDFESLLRKTIDLDFIRDKTVIFLIRDPRDILISSYYSFGFTHKLSKVPAIREFQEERKRHISGMSLDEFVLESVDAQINYFNILNNLSINCENSVVLRYEDMINDFESFIEQMRIYVSIDDTTVQEIYRRTRPKIKEDIKSHRRSGMPGGFRDKLETRTIETINKKLADTLTLFGYSDS